MTRPDVVVIGAGAAGLAATAALADAGAPVLLVERKPYVGGRAYSYEHPALGETIDSQHVLLGCCTNLIDLSQQAGIADSIRWYDAITFLEPGGRRSVLQPGLLPSPSHSALSFLRAPMLGVQDKAVVAAGLMRFLRGIPASDDESFAEWLEKTGQTEQAVRHFWEPVVVGALNDTFERCSTRYAAQVFYESFLKSAEGGRLGIPAAPLSDFYAGIARYAEARGAEIRLRCSVGSLQQTAQGNWLVEAQGELIETPSVVLAVPFEQVAPLLASLPQDERRSGLEANLAHFTHAPITTIHLWFDREITELDHAALLDTRIQWIFHKSRIRRWPVDQGSYVELVISASFHQLHESREVILEAALRELELFFPAARQATLLKSAVLKEARATFSVLPGLDAHRPTQTTAWPGLYLAGDWTASGWTSTMEGAVRSGRMAAEAVARANDVQATFLLPELPASGLMRLL